MAISPIPHWFEGSEYTHKVAACIMKYGPISRITLAQILGLSQGAVSRITSDLIYAGVIEETPMAAGMAASYRKISCGNRHKSQSRKKIRNVAAVRRPDCASSPMRARSSA